MGVSILILCICAVFVSFCIFKMDREWNIDKGESNVSKYMEDYYTAFNINRVNKINANLKLLEVLSITNLKVLMDDGEEIEIEGQTLKKFIDEGVIEEKEFFDRIEDGKITEDELGKSCGSREISYTIIRFVDEKRKAILNNDENKGNPYEFWECPCCHDIPLCPDDHS